MANYEQLKAAVSQVIKENGNNEITGVIMQNILTTIISTIGQNKQFAGLAVPTTVPGTPDANIFYLASTPGIYSNFNSIEVKEGELFVFSNTTSWVGTKVFSIDIANLSTKKETKSVEDRLTGQMTKTNNIINYRDFKGMTFAVSQSTNKVVEEPTANWLGVKISEGFIGGQTYFLDGAGYTSNNAAPIVMFSDVTNTHISTILKADFNGVVTVPLNTKYIYIRIVNAVNIGVNPTDNQYINITQMKLGNISTPFEPYGYKINFPIASQSVIKNDENYISGAAVYNEFDKLINQSYNLINYQDFKGGVYQENSTTSIINLNSSSLNWLSVRVEVEENTEYYLQGIRETMGAATPILLFGDSTQKLISKVLKQDFNGSFTTPLNTKYIYIRIENAIDIGVNPTDNQYINKVQLTKGSFEKPFQKFGNIYIKEDVLPNNNVDIDNPNIFVKLTPVTETYNGVMLQKEVAAVYVKLKGNFYVRHSLIYQRLEYENFVSGDFSGGEVIRYAGSKLATYDPINNIFTDSSVETIRTLENEFVLSSGFWSGGYHGNENYINCFFMINGKPYNENGKMDFEPLELTPCENFDYIMSSKIKLHSNKTDLCDRLKVCNFENGGYRVRTKLKGLQAATAMMYVGICCVGKMFENIISDTGNKYIATGSGGNLVENDSFAREFFYSNSDYYLNITDFIYNEPTADKDATILIWDRAGDTKYYRRVSDYNFEVNKTIEFEQVVKIKKR